MTDKKGMSIEDLDKVVGGIKGAIENNEGLEDGIYGRLDAYGKLGSGPKEEFAAN